MSTGTIGICKSILLGLLCGTTINNHNPISKNSKNYQGLYSSSQSIDMQLYSITQHLRLDRRMTGTDRVGIIRYLKLVISEFQKPCYISKTLHLKQESTLIFDNFDFLGQFSKILRFSKFSKFYISKVILHFIDSLPPCRRPKPQRGTKTNIRTP